MSLNAEVFNAEDLRTIKAPKVPVVLKSGGPIMNLRCIEGGRAFCEWDDNENEVIRKSFPVECLYSCFEVSK